jgi:hypothetical protein
VLGTVNGTRRTWNFLILLLASIVVLFSLVLTTDGHQVYLFGRTLPGTCAFESMMGFRCPGCGLTRSFVQTAHFHWGEAFRLHPLGPLGFLAVLLQIPWRLHKLKGRQQDSE